MRVLDLGCGTGALACALAGAGHRVTGVDPAAAMLAVARRKPHAEKVEWVQSFAQSFRSERRFDLILMTGHAFQCLLSDEDILGALATIRMHFDVVGRVAFETRNPKLDWASEWAGKAPVVYRMRGEQVVETLEVTGREDDFVSFQTHYQFEGDALSTNSRLRFPSREQVEEWLARSGLRVCEVFGDWSGRRFEGGGREMIFVAESAA